MNSLFLLFFNPKTAFENMKTIEKFSVTSMIILLFLMLLNLILMIPINEKITEVTFSSMNLNEDQVGVMLQVSHKMRYLQVAGAEILYIGMLLFYAFLLYLSVRISKSRLDYKKSLQLLVYSYFIIATGDLVNTVMLYTKGLDTINNLYGTSLIGVNLLTTVEQMGATGYTFLSYINPFQLGFVCLLSFGLKILSDTKWLKSLIVCTLVWLSTILIPTLSVYFSQLTLETKGIL
jgi:hypothetical protein